MRHRAAVGNRPKANVDIASCVVLCRKLSTITVISQHHAAWPIRIKRFCFSPQSAASFDHAICPNEDDPLLPFTRPVRQHVGRGLCVLPARTVSVQIALAEMDSKPTLAIVHLNALRSVAVRRCRAKM